MAKEKIILVVGASAGGSSVLPDLIRQITSDMKITVLLVLHLSKTAIGELLVNRLQKSSTLKCKIAAHGEAIKDGHIYIALPDHHLLLKKDKLLLGKGPMENRYRPSIDALFRSAAVSFPSRVIGIILTGLLEDGASGMHAIKKTGGICMIQDPKEARYPDMPRAVLQVIKPDYSLPVSEMGEAIKEAITTLKKRKRVKVPADIAKEAEIAERVNIGIEQVKDLGEKMSVSCPDCGGALWEIKDNGFSRYRCHVGHAFSEEGLMSSMEASTEATLWIALRMIEERKNLLRQIAEKESKRGMRNLATTYLKRSAEMEEHAQKLKELLFSVARDPR